jgi:osmotically-inducible protein OsmY
MAPLRFQGTKEKEVLLMNLKARQMCRKVSGGLALGLTVLLLFFGQSAAALTDIDIADRVEDELLMDIAIPAYLIDVAVQDGVVTLSGSVSDLLAKERAASIAETVKGVRAVVNTITISPSISRSDKDIEADVEQALLADRATDSYEVNVDVNNHTVTLTGTVDSWQERDLSATVAKGVRGVTAVENKIQVNHKDKRPDTEIKAEVEKALHWDTLVDDSLIEVQVVDGRVDLTGTVGSAAEKSQAVINAYVAGVERVNSEKLKVRMWAREPELRTGKYDHKGDEQIRQAIMDALNQDPRVTSSFSVVPYVDNGVVTLRGTVDNLKAKRAAEMDARHTVGVWSVENRIKVRPANDLGDQSIESRVKKALIRDPVVESYEITVDADNGIVDLYGTVDTYYEKATADDVASRILGVIAVDNNIVVSNSYDPYRYDPYVDDWSAYDYPWYHYPKSVTHQSDSEIKEEIGDELFWSPFVDADDVKVYVDDGVATLTGTVDSWSEYTAAHENALEGGAVAVRNQLEIANFNNSGS